MNPLDSPKLRPEARRVMLDGNEAIVAAASIWEIAIKAKIGKIEGDPAEFVEVIGSSGFRELEISARHAARVHRLPLYHRDPFGRLLIAQAIVEPMRLLTVDSVLGQYSELVMTVSPGKMIMYP